MAPIPAAGGVLPLSFFEAFTYALYVSHVAQLNILSRPSVIISTMCSSKLTKPYRKLPRKEYVTVYGKWFARNARRYRSRRGTSHADCASECDTSDGCTPLQRRYALKWFC